MTRRASAAANGRNRHWLRLTKLATACALFLFALSPASAAQTASHGLGLREVATLFPTATRVGPVDGTPPAVRVFRNDELLGYAFHSFDTVGSTGFSGRPIDVLIGLGLDARITDLRIVEHHEPILAIGIDDAALAAFVGQYKGRDVRQPARLRNGRAGTADQLDGISGASISSIVLNDAILRSARNVAQSRGLLGTVTAAGALDLERYEKLDWPALLGDGSIGRLHATVSEVRAMLPDAEITAPAEATFIDLYAALAIPARIGRNLLGDRHYAQMMAELRNGEPVIFIGGAGLYSFKGTAFARTGVFDRLAIAQGEHSFRLRRDDYQRLDRLQVERAPELIEAGLFRLPAESSFDPAQPWRLDLLIVGSAQSGDRMTRVTLDYRLPDLYMPAAAANLERAGDEATPLWREVWLERSGMIAILVSALAVLLLILLFQDWLVRRQPLYQALRIGYLMFTLLWLGWWAGAQLSVLNVLTFLHSLLTGFRWDFFLLDPLMFVLWSFVAVAMLFWGRAIFCGWLCPFGALQELVNRLSRKLGVRQLRVPFLLHERLWPIKYVIFVGLFALSLQSLELAQPWAEVEPFKTTIVLKFARPAIYTVYAGALLLGSVFVERLFCRYLCPLGGALAVPARLRMFEWLKRKRQCGTECQICAQRCPVQAIHPTGQINPNECINCLACQVLYYDDKVCPPLIERRKRHALRAELKGTRPGKRETDAGAKQ